MQISNDGLFFHVVSLPNNYFILNRNTATGEVDCSTPSSSASLSYSPSISVSKSVTVTASFTPTASETPTKSSTPSSSGTVSLSPSATLTVSVTPSRTATVTVTRTATPPVSPPQQQSTLVTPTTTPSESESKSTKTPTSTPRSTDDCYFRCDDVCVSSNEECLKQITSGLKLTDLDLDSKTIKISSHIAKELGKDADTAKVVPVTITLTSDRDLEVPVIGARGNDAIKYGRVNIGSNAFPEGWTITITPAYKDSLERTGDDSSGCGDSSDKEQSVTSLAFNLDVFDEHGKKQKISKLSGKDITFDMIVTLPESLADKVFKWLQCKYAIMTTKCSFAFH
eukprot:TRINITY_DN2851_c1_g1_i3.p1 TRINITY_DN2851_c1_g1~~TRINITY_DN2851_c1_g1_i3.p1  ORF type:complete len:339 (-),score=69.54 TRINITY_DN2851_c1_g1_i3:659-1675(-)